jgi:ribosome-binding factor A
MKKFLLATVTALFCFSLMAQTTMLKMSLEKNRVYRLRSLTNQTVSQTINGNQQTTESNVDYVFSVKMVDITPDFMIAEVHFDTLITKSNAMGKQVNISSAVEGDIKSSETADVMSCIMNRLSKNAIFSKIDFTGKPMEILNGKMLSDMILKDTSAITLTGPVAAAVKSQVAATVNDNTLKTMIEMFTWYLPGKQISKGEEWTHTSQTNSGGMTLDVTTVYHLDGANGDFANVSGVSTIKTAVNAKPIQSGGATVTYDNLQGISKFNLLIDTRTGLLAENKGKSHITGNLGISGPGFSMQMPMDINSESTVTALP